MSFSAPVQSSSNVVHSSTTLLEKGGKVETFRPPHKLTTPIKSMIDVSPGISVYVEESGNPKVFLRYLFMEAPDTTFAVLIITAVIQIINGLIQKNIVSLPFNRWEPSSVSRLYMTRSHIRKYSKMSPSRR